MLSGTLTLILGALSLVPCYRKLQKALVKTGTLAKLGILFWFLDSSTQWEYIVFIVYKSIISLCTFSGAFRERYRQNENVNGSHKSITRGGLFVVCFAFTEQPLGKLKQCNRVVYRLLRNYLLTVKKYLCLATLFCRCP